MRCAVLRCAVLRCAGALMLDDSPVRLHRVSVVAVEKSNSNGAVRRRADVPPGRTTLMPTESVTTGGLAS